MEALLLLGLLNGQSRKNAGMHRCTYMHTPQHLSVCVPIYSLSIIHLSIWLCIYHLQNHEFTHIPLAPVQYTGFVPAFSLSVCEIPPGNTKKAGFHDHIIFTYLLNHRIWKADLESLTNSMMKNKLITRIKYVFTLKCVISLRYIVKILCSTSIWFSIPPPF